MAKFEVGDKVAVVSRFVFNTTFSTVKKITPKGFIRLQNGSLFTADGELKTSESFISSFLVKVESGFLKRQIPKEIYERSIRSLSGKEINPDDLKAIFGDKADRVCVENVREENGKYFVVFFYRAKE